MRSTLPRLGRLRPAPGGRIRRGGGSAPPFDPGDDNRRRRLAPAVAAGLLAICVLGMLALFNSMANVRADERAQLHERTQLIKGLATWASVSDNPDLLADAVRRSGFDPASPEQNTLSLRAFQITPAGDTARLVALLDHEGRTLASIPPVRAGTNPSGDAELASDVGVPGGTGVPGGSVLPGDTATSIGDYQLGDAWSRAWSGKAAMSTVFTLRDKASRAMVAPVGDGTPWAVLVVVSDEGAIGRLASDVDQLIDMTDGCIATVDATGTAILSSDSTLLGRTVVDPSQTIVSDEQLTRVWTSGQDSAETTYVAVGQPATGYTTVFWQRTAALHADLRDAHHQRGLTVLVVTIGAVLSIAGFGFAREYSARRARARLHTLLSSAHDVIVVVDTDGVTTFVSPAIRPLLGHDPDAFRSRPLTELAHRGDVSRIERLLNEPSRRTELNVRLRSRTGDYRWFDLATSNASEHPEFAGVIVTCHEVGKRKSLQDQLGHQAGHDPLTGLPNRETFRARVDEALLENFGSKPVAVLFVDLDRFKPVNDTFGHQAGDEVLRVVASRLDKAVGDHGVASRFGGDEFGVVAPVADVGSARMLADSVIAAVQRPIVVDNRTVSVDASVGVALSAPHYHDCENLLRAADQAMYAAKRAGRGQYALAGSTGRRLGGLPVAPPEPHGPADTTRPGAATAASDWTSDLPDRIASRARNAAIAGHRRRHARDSRSVEGDLRRRLGRAVPAVAVGAVLLATTVGGLFLEADTRQEARAQRLAERQHLTTWLADYTGAITNPERLVGPASQSPWTFDDSPLDQTILRHFAESPVAGQNPVVALLDLEGRVISSYPRGVVVPFGPGDEVWTTAMAGRGANAPLVDDGDVVRAYILAPVLRGPAPVAMMLIGQSIEQTPAATLLAMLGSLGFDDGGISILDIDGRAAYSWRRDYLGERLASPQELATVPAGGAARLSRSDRHEPAGAETVELASPILALPNGGYVYLCQPADVFYAGIQGSHRLRDSMLFAITGVTLLALAASNLRRERALRVGETYLRVLLHHAHDTVAVLDRDNRATFVSSAVEHLLGHDADALIGRPFQDLVHPEDATRLLRSTPDLGGTGRTTAVHVEDVRLRAADGSYRWFDVDAADLRAEPAVGGLLLTCHEISERKTLQEELHRRATHDPLTGLPNRAALSAYLASRRKRESHLDPRHDPQNDPQNGPRQEPQPLCVLLVDLDDFKPVNDTLGHAAGDEVLRVVAIRLRQACRAGDAVFRLGGDEFVVVTPAEEAVARILAERLRALVCAPITVADTSVTVDATIGIAIAADDSGRPDAVVRDADLAMYEAKRLGRGRHQVFESRPSELPQRS